MLEITTENIIKVSVPDVTCTKSDGVQQKHPKKFMSLKSAAAIKSTQVLFYPTKITFMMVILG